MGAQSRGVKTGRHDSSSRSAPSDRRRASCAARRRFCQGLLRRRPRRLYGHRGGLRRACRRDDRSRVQRVGRPLLPGAGHLRRRQVQPPRRASGWSSSARAPARPSCAGTWTARCSRWAETRTRRSPTSRSSRWGPRHPDSRPAEDPRPRRRGRRGGCRLALRRRPAPRRSTFDDGSVDLGTTSNPRSSCSAAGVVTDSTLRAPPGDGFATGGTEATVRRSTLDAAFGALAAAGHLTMSDTLVDLRGTRRERHDRHVRRHAADGATSSTADLDRLTIVGSTPRTDDRRRRLGRRRRQERHRPRARLGDQRLGVPVARWPPTARRPNSPRTVHLSEQRSPARRRTRQPGRAAPPDGQPALRRRRRRRFPSRPPTRR